MIDITGIKLTPGNNGNNCLGNGEHIDENGERIECCCDECNYMNCCFIMKNFSNCHNCGDIFCPHSATSKINN